MPLAVSFVSLLVAGGISIANGRLGEGGNHTVQAQTSAADAAYKWPPRNVCKQYKNEAECNSAEDGDTCGWNCWSRENNEVYSPFGPSRCWPKGKGWGCAYNGGGRYCNLDTQWSCPSQWGQSESAGGCYCWFSYAGARECCPCPAVENCASRAHVSCGRDGYGGSVSHLHTPTCSKCKEGYISNSDGSACLLDIAESESKAEATDSKGKEAEAEGSRHGSGGGGGGRDGEDGGNHRRRTTTTVRRATMTTTTVTTTTRHRGRDEDGNPGLGRRRRSTTTKEATTTIVEVVAPTTTTPPTTTTTTEVTTTTEDSTCSVRFSDRIDCGYFGVTASDCESMGCCYHASPPAPNSKHIPYCFYPEGVYPTTTTTTLPTWHLTGRCDQSVGSRKDCGFYNITVSECYERGCCYTSHPKPNPNNRPWCFYPEEEAAETASVVYP